MTALYPSASTGAKPEQLRQFARGPSHGHDRRRKERKLPSHRRAEAKGRGYDVKVLRKIIALRKRDENDIAEEEAVLEMYKEALGMS